MHGPVAAWPAVALLTCYVIVIFRVAVAPPGVITKDGAVAP